LVSRIQDHLAPRYGVSEISVLDIRRVVLTKALCDVPTTSRLGAYCIQIFCANLSCSQETLSKSNFDLANSKLTSNKKSIPICRLFCGAEHSRESAATSVLLRFTRSVVLMWFNDPIMPQYRWLPESRADKVNPDSDSAAQHFFI